MNSRTKLIALSAVFFLFSTEAMATSIRCGNHVIHSGGRNDTGKYEVLKKCGEPAERYGNTWVYESYGKQRTVIVFKDSGAISSIKRAD